MTNIILIVIIFTEYCFVKKKMSVHSFFLNILIFYLIHCFNLLIFNNPISLDRLMRGWTINTLGRQKIIQSK